MRIFFGLLSAACMIIAAIVILTPSTQAQKAQPDEATVVVKGQSSQTERGYSKEYEKLYLFRNGRKFSEIIEENIGLGTGYEQISGSLGEHETIFLPGVPEITTAQLLERLSCASDAIVIGYTKSKASHITTDETFIYTAYDFLTEKVIKNNSASSMQIDSSIEVTRPGGAVRFDNRLIKIEDRSYAALQVGRKYMLFLRYVPAAKGYVTAGPEGDFLIDGDSFQRLATRPLPKDLEAGNDSQELITSVVKAVKSGCNQKS